MTKQEREWLKAIREGRASVVYRPTPDTCRHPGMQGSGSMSSDGSGHVEGHCTLCGYSYRHETPPRSHRERFGDLVLKAALPKESP